MDEQKQLKKDRECIRCEHIFDCEGKPRNVNQCLNFKEVKRDGGKQGKI